MRKAGTRRAHNRGIRLGGALVALVCVAAGASCSDEGAGTDGAAGAGGTPATGGAAGSGGSPATGGGAGSGGSPATGGEAGNAGVGGSAGTAGVAGDAGTGGTGGTTPDGGAGAGGTTDAGVDAGPGFSYLIEPELQCGALASPCQAVDVDTGLYASYRKDYSLDEADYPEYTDPPVDGGRFQIATVSAVTGDWTHLKIDGVNAEDQQHQPDISWYHVWPRHLKAGEPMWIAFHSKNPKWDAAGATGQIVVHSTGGDAVNTTFSVTKSPVPMTYVTTTDAMDAFLVHLKNEDTVPHTMTRLLVGGRDVLGAGVACVPSTTLQPGEVAMLRVPLCQPAQPGDAWTVVAEWQNAPASVGTGRVLPPFFPVEAWPVGSECPMPTINDTNYDRHRAAGFDTLYMYWGGKHEGDCHYDGKDIVNSIAPGLGDGAKILIGDDFLHHASPETAITDTSAVAGFLTGDESDGKVYDDDGNSIPATKANDARRLWDMYPGVPVYNGAKTHGNVGAFAGMCDIQGIDYYAAACAPHITNWGSNPRLRGPYDFLRNARNNHMPLPTWLYAQGLSSVWNKDIPLIGERVFQPDPQEVTVQAMMVAAAGGKGLMWFQSNLVEADRAPHRWDTIAFNNWSFRGVRTYLRQGDVTGYATTSMTDEQGIVEMIRSPEALIVIAINILADQWPTDVSCASAQSTGVPAPPHFVLASQTPWVHAKVPMDFGVYEAFEVRNGQILDLAYGADPATRTVSFDQVSLDNGNPARLFVIAANPDVRAEVAASMSH